MSLDISRLFHRLLILSVVNVMISLAAIIIGAVAVNTSNGKFPYNAGGGVIAGTTAIFLSVCPLYSYCKFKQSYSGDHSCCMLCMVIYFGSVSILAAPIAMGMCGIYGLAECGNPDTKVCVENKEIKTAMCYLTVFLSAFLIVLELAIFFTCCCNASKFDIPLTTSTSANYFDPEIRRYIEQAQNQIRENERRDRENRELRERENRERNIDRPSHRSEVPTAPDLDLGADINPSDFSWTPERNRGPSLSDPPPSYDEVMGTPKTGVESTVV